MDVISTIAVIVIIVVAAIVAYLWHAFKIVEQDLEGY